MSEDYADSFDLAKGITLTLEPQLRVVKVRGGEDDDIFVVPPHWHESHDELITVLEGKLKVTIGSEVKVCTPESGTAFVPRGISHSLEGYKGVPSVFTERTNPTNFDTKELFFRNLLAIPGGLESGSLVPAMQVFYHGDGYPVFPIHWMWLEKAFVVIIGGYIAPLLGYRLKYESLKKT
ncbi:hypothetical protein GYMLUDRAFT_234117 [Collybiopsis luxurians FD-317 M1]|uniref:Cupin type-2 domain-containing protein n=1 Tax=Collybiopsis luxurians FD-317 M1 TaxID=944289 RepID=A0A0D0AMF0_9AGAR|nr:hypothetical protein GYMLUDRAFT_234117 [Collybiopsis luxurians FD-317 M1]